MWEELYAPFLKEFCSFVHRNSDLKIFMHSCGSIKPFIPALIDCGVDMLNPVQISASNMDPVRLKKEYGDRITFWGGGCNTQHVLNHGNPENIARTFACSPRHIVQYDARRYYPARGEHVDGN